MHFGAMNDITETVSITLDDDAATEFYTTIQITTIDCYPSIDWFEPPSPLTATALNAVTVSLNT